MFCNFKQLRSDGVEESQLSHFKKVSKLFFGVKEPKPSEMPAGASPTPLPVRFLNLRAEMRLILQKIAALPEAANLRRSPHKSIGNNGTE